MAGVGLVFMRASSIQDRESEQAQWLSRAAFSGEYCVIREANDYEAARLLYDREEDWLHRISPYRLMLAVLQQSSTVSALG
jgi:hypothetical protein